MVRTTRFSLTVALGVGAAVGWLASSDAIPLSRTVLAAGAVTPSASASVRTPGGRQVTLIPAGSRAAATEIAAAQASGGAKPNVLVIFGDDVGQTNISA